MANMHRIILQRVMDCVRDHVDHARIVDETDRLDELGIDSMATIAILVVLEQEFDLDVGRMLDATPPKNLHDLAAMAVRALPAKSSHTVVADKESSGPANLPGMG